MWFISYHSGDSALRPTATADDSVAIQYRPVAEIIINISRHFSTFPVMTHIISFLLVILFVGKLLFIVVLIISFKLHRVAWPFIGSFLFIIANIIIIDNNSIITSLGTSLLCCKQLETITIVGIHNFCTSDIVVHRRWHLVRVGCRTTPFPFLCCSYCTRSVAYFWVSWRLRSLPNIMWWWKWNHNRSILLPWTQTGV